MKAVLRRIRRGVIDLVLWARRQRREHARRFWTVVVIWDLALAVVPAVLLAWWAAPLVAFVVVPTWCACLFFENVWVD